MTSEREVMKKHIVGSCFMSLFVIGYLATVGLFVYQLVNKVFHIIPTVSVIILTFIAIPVIKDMFTPHKNTEKVKVNGKWKNRKSVSGRIVFGGQRGYTAGNVITALAMMLVMLVLGGIAFAVVKKKEANCTSVVVAEVLDWRVDTTVETTTDYRGVRSKESSVIVLSLAYEYEGQLIKTTYELGTSAKQFKPTQVTVCLNEVGEIVSTYDSIRMLKIAILICLAMAVYYLILAVFGFPIECAILGIFFAAGVGLFFLLNGISLNNWMYNEFSVFCLMFATCGVTGFVAFLNVIFLPDKKDKDEIKESDFISPRLRQEGVEAEDFENINLNGKNDNNRF